jgi:hypothetical protein
MSQLNDADGLAINLLCVENEKEKKNTWANLSMLSSTFSPKQC